MKRWFYSLNETQFFFQTFSPLQTWFFTSSQVSHNFFKASPTRPAVYAKLKIKSMLVTCWTFIAAFKVVLLFFRHRTRLKLVIVLMFSKVRKLYSKPVGYLDRNRLENVLIRLQGIARKGPVD